jgi:hypothetical protein
LINTIASNRKLEVLQGEVQKVQEQNANLKIGLQQAYSLIEELRKGHEKQGKTTDHVNRIPTNLTFPQKPHRHCHTTPSDYIDRIDKIPGLRNNMMHAPPKLTQTDPQNGQNKWNLPRRRLPRPNE